MVQSANQKGNNKMGNTIYKSPCNCGHDIDRHTYSEDYQGCDLCECTFNVGDALALAVKKIEKLEAVAEKLSQRLRANERAANNREVNEDGCFMASPWLLFDDEDASALAEYEAMKG